MWFHAGSFKWFLGWFLMIWGLYCLFFSFLIDTGMVSAAAWGSIWICRSLVSVGQSCSFAFHFCWIKHFKRPEVQRKCTATVQASFCLLVCLFFVKLLCFFFFKHSFWSGVPTLCPRAAPCELITHPCTKSSPTHLCTPAPLLLCLAVLPAMKMDNCLTQRRREYCISVKVDYWIYRGVTNLPFLMLGFWSIWEKQHSNIAATPNYIV